MTEYVTGQIYGWNGGECPVHPESVVMAWYRAGGSVKVLCDSAIPAGHFWWKHSDSDGDIIAFQVIKPYVEPKLLWVNEYKEGDVGHSFPTEEQAKRQALRGVTRIAVKYVEMKE
jgi:hypothetical protein